MNLPADKVRSLSHVLAERERWRVEGLRVVLTNGAFDLLHGVDSLRLAERISARAREADLTLTDSRQHSGPSYTLMFILMFMLMSAKDLVQEHRQRTLDRLRLAWPSTGDIVAGFFLAGCLVGLFQAALLLVLNSVIFGIDFW